MKASILALLATAAALIEASKNEIRERCSDPTHAKFVSLQTELNDAIREGSQEPQEVPQAAPLLTEEAIEAAIEKLGDHLGDRMALEIRAALDEHAAS